MKNGMVCTRFWYGLDVDVPISILCHDDCHDRLFLVGGFRPGWGGMMREHLHETPRQILDRRYASGEIMKDQV